MFSYPNDVIMAYLDGDHGLRRAGRILFHSNQVHVLEDYYGLLAHIPEGPITQATIDSINSCGWPIKMISEGAVLAGDHLDMVPERKLDTPIYHQNVTLDQINEAQSLPAKSSFHYQRTGMDTPVVLESHSNGRCYYDGNPLQPKEIELILNNIRSGLATISHLNTSVAEQFAKAERIGFILMKNDFGTMPEEIEYFRKLVSANPTPEGQRHLDNMVAQYYIDPMMHENGLKIGNKRARNDHLKANPNTTVVGIDANNFKGINDTHGHLAGDKALVAYGRALRNAVDKVGGGKLFRHGGDEFEVHFPSPDHAHQFARHLRTELDAIPHVGGTHKLSMSMGIGKNPEEADQALYEAKKQKAGHSLTSIPSVLAHSLHSSKPGVVPTAEVSTGTPKAAAPAPVKNTPAPAPKPATPASLPKPDPKPAKVPDNMMRSEEAAKLSKTEEIKILSEALVDFRRGGYVVDMKGILSTLGIDVVQVIKDEE